MATTLTTAARNAACDAVCALVNGGKIELLTAADALVATLNLSATAFGAAVNGVATANAIANGVAAAGTVTKYQVKNSSNVVIWTGTVTANGGGGDLQLSSTTYSLNDVASISSFTHTQPA